ncbi:NAD-dependent epimerase/dehydratase family protein [Haloarcula nitratireducens]|uniref:NAD-dependent epimerase/dehydratase family protein n=1 Tax=Haloarcula nitratireducens TaxID=2487749 RepID=A0AAW4P6N4_9EURY|nr:NAD-dependent epimerase/dehydratase family protein [Halomicroarcula nitratireducens]MBX0293521.1 NAD-dependent epimerase/dehydratase family protein [Halomicroarcula nitratireducens]
MDQVLIVGGTRFIGRYTVSEFRDADYDVTIFNRGNHDNPFADDEGVNHVQGNRRDREDLAAAREEVDPDVVVDCVAYFPEDVRVATDVFADVEAYVYVSSGAAYGQERVPKREGDTALEPCSEEEATTDSSATYGPRKAEGDREVFAAAEDGVRAMSVRPTVVYGPHDYTERFAYWVDRVAVQDRIAVPSDGMSLWQMAYVEDVASALRVVAEEGDAGEAYNVGDEHAPMLGQWVELLAETLQTGVETVGTTERDLARHGLTPQDFPIHRASPHLLETAKLRELGWSSTPHRVALQRTVDEHRENDRTGRQFGPDRDVEEELLDDLTQ